MAGYDAVAGKDLVRQAEIAGAMGDKAVELHEGAGIEEEIEPLAGGELPLLVLRCNPRLTPALFRERLAMVEFLEQLPGIGHG